MAGQTWNYLIFSATILVAAIAWWLAWLTYFRGKKSYIHKTLALTWLFFGLWVSSSWIEKIFYEPSDGFTTLTYHWAFIAAIAGLTCYLLFALSLYLGKKPPPKYSLPLQILGLIAASLAASPLVIVSASYSHGESYLNPGPLYFVVIAFMAMSVLAIIVLNFKQFFSSSGNERAQANIRLFGWAIFFTLAPSLGFIIPAINGNQATAQYASLIGIAPLSFDFYAIMRFRFLDIRIILRKSGLYVLAAIAFCSPVLLAYLLFSELHFQLWAERTFLLILILLLTLSAPWILRHIKEFSSKYFFSGVYDEAELLKKINTQLLAESSLPESILAVLSEIAASLCLMKAELLVFKDMAHAENWCFGVHEQDSDTEKRFVENEYIVPEILETIEAPFLVGEQSRWPDSESNRRKAEALSHLRLSACLPLEADQGLLGLLLTGERANGRALSSTDVSFLTEVSNYLGIYIEKYSLGADLAFRLEELQRVHRELRKADRFKKEIIDITAHELRTPLTILSSFVSILLERYEKIDPEERREYFGYVKESCQRLNTTINQFIMVSDLQKTDKNTKLQQVELNHLLSNITSSFEPSLRSRIRCESPGTIYLKADLFYLQLMLKNIIANALRFSPEEKPVILSAEITDEHAEIFVQDFGDGIQPDEVKRVFDPFIRLEDLDEHHAGTGLGLYAVRLIADLLGTKINVKAGPGGGTIFSCQMQVEE